MTTAVVVGSGPNGLAAAVVLARAGIDVTVLEAEDEIGGGTRSAELNVPGVLHDICSATHPTAVASPFFQSLDLGRHGLEWLWPEVDAVHPLDGGRAGVLFRDLDRTVEGLGVDGKAWRKLYAPLAESSDELIGELFRPIVHVPKHPILMAKFGLRALQPASWIARRWKTDEARGLFAGLAAHAIHPLDRPTTGGLGLMFGMTSHAYGWPVAKGGSAAIARALAADIVEHGGRIETGHEVTELPAGRHRHLRHLAAGRAPHRRRPAAPPRPPAAQALALRTRRVQGRLRGRGRDPVDQRVGAQGRHPAPRRDVRGAQCRRAGGPRRPDARPPVRAALPAVPRRPGPLGRRRAPRVVVRARAQRLHRRRDRGDHRTRSSASRPGFRDRIVAKTTAGPAQLEAHNANYAGGDIGGGANDAWQLVMRPRFSANPYSLGAKGLYICSASTPPGGGVHGMGGFHAATAAWRTWPERPVANL